MLAQNIKALERLGLFCHISGLCSVFIGMMVCVLDLLNKDFAHIQVGFYVFISGYAFVKIAKRLAAIVLIESHPSSYKF